MTAKKDLRKGNPILVSDLAKVQDLLVRAEGGHLVVGIFIPNRALASFTDFEGTDGYTPRFRDFEIDNTEGVMLDGFVPEEREFQVSYRANDQWGSRVVRARSQVEAEKMVAAEIVGSITSRIVKGKS